MHRRSSGAGKNSFRLSLLGSFAIEKDAPMGRTRIYLPIHKVESPLAYFVLDPGPPGVYFLEWLKPLVGAFRCVMPLPSFASTCENAQLKEDFPFG